MSISRQEKTLSREYLEAGQEFERERDYVQALSMYLSAAEILPYNPRVHFNLGNVYRMMGNTEAAKTKYGEAINLDPKYVKARLNLAILLDEEGETREAMSQYEHLLELFDQMDAGEKPPASLVLPVMLRLAEHLESIELFETTLGLSEDPFIYASLANLYADQRQDYDKAYQLLHEALLLDENYVPAMRIKGQIMAHQGRLHEASVVLTRAFTKLHEAELEAYTSQDTEALARAQESPEWRPTTNALVTVLQWKGQHQKADAVLHNVITERQLWEKMYQHPPTFTAGVPSFAWWDHLFSQPLRYPKFHTLRQMVKDQWKRVEAEFHSLVESGAMNAQHENLIEPNKGDWRHVYIIDPGEKVAGASQCDQQGQCENTFGLLDKIQKETAFTIESASFSMIAPGTHIRVHVGPHNDRIKVHFGLKIPKGASITCGREPPRIWDEGDAIVFDDSFEHEVKYFPGGNKSEAPWRAILEVCILTDTKELRALPLTEDQYEKQYGEKVHKPTIHFAPVEEDKKGSAPSQIHDHDEL